MDPELMDILSAMGQSGSKGQKDGSESRPRVASKNFEVEFEGLMKTISADKRSRSTSIAKSDKPMRPASKTFSREIENIIQEFSLDGMRDRSNTTGSSHGLAKVSSSSPEEECSEPAKESSDAKESNALTIVEESEWVEPLDQSIIPTPIKSNEGILESCGNRDALGKEHPNNESADSSQDGWNIVESDPGAANRVSDTIKPEDKGEWLVNETHDQVGTGAGAGAGSASPTGNTDGLGATEGASSLEN